MTFQNANQLKLTSAVLRVPPENKARNILSNSVNSLVLTNYLQSRPKSLGPNLTKYTNNC